MTGYMKWKLTLNDWLQELEAIMGAWGELAFDNDSANDWAYGLDDVEDLSLVEAAFQALENVGNGYLDADLGCNALAACEVLARARGNFGYKNAYTEKVDLWVEQHKPTPSDSLLRRASSAIDRVLGGQSELKDLFEDEAHNDEWRKAVMDLRQRLTA
jgi:hypothetical protein